MNETTGRRSVGSGTMVRPAAADLLRRELQMRGTSLEQFAGNLGLTAERVARMVEGCEMPMPELELELREVLGVELRSLRQVA